MKLLLPTIIALTIGVPNGRVNAQVVVPLGTEFQVNTYTTGDQYQPAICSTADGRFVVVWSAERRTDGTEIIAQRYASDGQPAGTEFMVNTYMGLRGNGAHETPSVCCDEAGNFVVAWAQDGGKDGDEAGVFAQRIASDGAFLGFEFQVNTYTTDAEKEPSICCDADGNFVVAWTREPNNYPSNIFGQRFASNGTFQGTEFQVNTATIGADDASLAQDEPAICCSADGDFVIVWESAGGHDGDAEGVFGQRFADDGTFQGTEFQVNTFTSSYQGTPAICCSADGNFVVAWQSFGQIGTSYQYSVFGQRFTSAGGFRGSEFHLPASTEDNDFEPALCCDPNGDFVVSWGRSNDTGSDIFVRRFEDSGLALDGEVRVNFFTPSYQENSAVACSAHGNFVVVWESFEQDGSEDGVFGRRFGLFTMAATPALSWLGLGAVIVGLLVFGVGRLSRRPPA